MRIHDGPIRPTIDLQKEFIYRFTPRFGLTGSGVQYGATGGAANVETTVVDVFADPGYQISPRHVEAGLTVKWTVTASQAGTLMYHWRARQEYNDPVGTQRIGSWETLTNGTIGLLIGTAAGNNLEDTQSGYLPVPIAFPARFQLRAQNNVAGVAVGEIKNNSYIRTVGIVIPGT